MIDQLGNFYKSWDRNIELEGEIPINDQLKLESKYNLPWYQFNLPDFPLAEILSEVKATKDLFVPHRDSEGNHLWKGICLHGLGKEKTMCPEDYGILEKDAHYSWTEIADLCPITKRYFSESYPSEAYHRIRFMLIEPGGYILPHRDRERKGLRGPLSIPLTVPDECHFVVENFGRIPLESGKGYLIDLSNRHSVWNRSNEDRYHIIAEAHYKKGYNDFLKLIAQSGMGRLDEDEKITYSAILKKLGL